MRLFVGCRSRPHVWPGEETLMAKVEGKLQPVALLKDLPKGHVKIRFKESEGLAKRTIVDDGENRLRLGQAEAKRQTLERSMMDNARQVAAAAKVQERQSFGSGSNEKDNGTDGNDDFDSDTGKDASGSESDVGSDVDVSIAAMATKTKATKGFADAPARQALQVCQCCQCCIGTIGQPSSDQAATGDSQERQWHWQCRQCF